MEVVGYARVSTEDQARDGVSIAAQQAKIEAYAMVKDGVLLELIRDEGHSAKHLKRPGLERLLALVEGRRVETVIVYKLDRLTCSVARLNKLMKLFECKGVALVSLQESLDSTTATGRLMLNAAGVPTTTCGGCWLGNTVRQILLRTSPTQTRRVA